MVQYDPHSHSRSRRLPPHSKKTPLSRKESLTTTISNIVTRSLASRRVSIYRSRLAICRLALLQCYLPLQHLQLLPSRLLVQERYAVFKDLQDRHTTGPHRPAPDEIRPHHYRTTMSHSAKPDYRAQLLHNLFLVQKTEYSLFALEASLRCGLRIWGAFYRAELPCELATL